MKEYLCGIHMRGLLFFYTDNTSVNFTENLPKYCMQKNSVNYLFFLILMYLCGLKK